MEDQRSNSLNEDTFDPLTPPSAAGGVDHLTPLYSPKNTHLKTYTAGEDGSRLANAAKEFGLQNQRQPRKQVREPPTRRRRSTSGNLIRQFVLDPTTEDARMRAVWSSHSARLEEGGIEEEQRLYNRMAYTSLDDRDWQALLPTTIEEEPEVPDEEFDPHMSGVGGNLTSAMLGVIKGMVGPAILYLPHGFASAGYIVALPLMALSTIMYLYSSRCLLDAWKLESERSKMQDGRAAFLSYPELAFRALGPTGETMVKTGIALMQSGVCLTYLIFVPQNLHSSFLHLFGWDVSAEWWLTVMVGVQIPLSWIRDIRKLTPTNALANILILYGLLTCLGFALSEAANGEPGQGPLESIWSHISSLSGFESDWFLFIGTSVLLFEGSITLLVPLQEAVQIPEQRERFPHVYQNVILGIIGFYAIFGITCWASFGDDVRTVLTTSLPAGILATTVQLAYSIAVILTFPLQNFPALEIATKVLSSQATKACGNPEATSPMWWNKRNVWSSSLVCALAVIAVLTMQSLDKVVSLMGSLLGCPIAFLFPPLIHYQIAKDTAPSWRRVGNIVVAVLGVVAMIFAAITTLMAW